MVATPPDLVKQYVICLNSNMLGMLYEPAGFLGSPDNTMRDNPNEPTLHPLIRNWFGSQSPDGPHVNIDPYRRAMSLDYGYTYPLNGEGEYLINAYQYESASAPGTNTPYTYSDTLPGPTFGSLGFPSYAIFGFDSSTSDTLDLRFNEIGWNESLPPGLPDYSYGDTPSSVVSPYYASLLDEENRDEWNEGVPYFNKYLMGNPMGSAIPTIPGPIAPSAANPRMTSAGLVGTYSGLFANLLPVSFLNAEPLVLFDHTFGYTNANTYNIDDPNLPDPLSPGVTVESTYNFYVDSSPNYEDVIAPANIPECILPNFYMLQSSILQGNSPSPEVVHAYLEQVSAGTLNPDFQTLFRNVANAAASAAPAISEGYWNLYSTTLSNIDSTVLTEFEGKYKNIVVPLGSLDFISVQNEASSFSGDPLNPGPSGPFTALSAYPFYNKITLQPIGIPSDNDPNLGLERGQGGPQGSNPDFLAAFLAEHLTSLLDTAETTCFVRSLQLLIANSYNPDASVFSADKLTGLVAQDLIVDFPRRPALSMDLNFMGTGFSEESDQPQEIQHTLGKNQPIKVCAEVDKILDDATSLKDLTKYLSPYPYYYISLEKPGGTGTEKDINYSILRDAIAGNDYSHVSTWKNTAGASDRDEIREAIKDYTRNLNSVFKGQLSNVSPLMYLIEKRRIPDGELSVPLSVEPVQRIFITRDFRNPGDPSPITYYDTQIKYGVRYQYDVRVINIVFGTQYQYTNVASDPDLWYTEVEVVPLASSGRSLGNALGFYNEEEAQVTTMGNYLVGGTVDADGCQYNYLKLPDETDLDSGTNTNLTDPTMYFSDSGELGWPSTPYQTDIGEDPGWDSANGTTSHKADPAAGKPVGQTGFYVFGGPAEALSQNHSVESLQGRPAFPAWTVPFGTFYDQAGLLGQFDLESTISDPYGGEFDTPQPGGMYTPGAVGGMLSRMEVKVVGGLGHDGNSTGGLVPWNVNVPVEAPLGDALNVPGTPISWCEWLKIYHSHIAEAFRDWYVNESSFCSIGPLQTPTWSGVPYEWAMEGVDHPERGGWSCSTLTSTFNNRDIERWFHGDSNCMRAGPYPVHWSPGLGRNMLGWESYVTEFSYPSPGSLPNRIDEHGRQTAAWYCPNWNNHISNHTIWHPHSIYQIVYWLAKGASAQWAYASNHDSVNDPYAGTAPAYLYPKSDLGMNHGRQILNEFRVFWNSNWSSYGAAASRSHLGVYFNSPLALGHDPTIQDAIANDHGNAWSAGDWFQMIDRLYETECLGDAAWPTPASIIATQIVAAGSPPTGRRAP